VSDRVDAAMNWVKATRLGAATHPVLVQAKGAKLPDRDNAMLSRRQFRY
jgi:hypothetical protein